ncbi:PepSY domain-containing protein [Streptococcus pluranimalium]|uniref:PepSY domain-containing protein n=2 Tax=Streptococcus pluranimalium TaxID=82348 RepID=UPI00241595ED|nr:PepSY domain-containing protein [Streptococcus pluranimalium]MDY3041169.1 PepSY domain-containing protein [Streptococcus pluranimalium]WFM80203.1 PepSY domain-containing protein [Streptococcus pluranimalium]HEM6116044.1 PepSY domain-containing protein [Streptococcus suis]
MPFKKISLLAVTALSVLALAACDMDDDDKVEKQQNTTNQVAKKDNTSVKLSEKEAKKKAFEAAGVTEKEVINLQVEQDFDDATPTYEIDFVKDQTEYNYSIDANTGDILEESTEKADDLGNSSSQSVKLSQDEAKKKALESASLSEKDVQNLIIEEDFDDATPSYDIEFVKDGTEYSYTIDANTGDILEQSTESIND